MSNHFKIFLAVLCAVIIGNIFSSSLYSYWYQSETELAIEKSQRYIERYQKLNKENVESVIKYQEEKRRLTFENTMKNQLQAAQKNDSQYFNQFNRYDNLNKQRADQKEQKRLERIERRKQEKIKNEKRQIKQKRRIEDRKHIQKENMKTCQHWIKQHQLNPTIKNENFRQSSCERAYK